MIYYIIFKISALGFILQIYSLNFSNFSLDILIKSILIKKKAASHNAVRKKDDKEGNKTR